MDSPIQQFFLVTPFGIYCLYCSPGTSLVLKNTQDLIDHVAKRHKRIISVIDDSYDILQHEKKLLKMVISKNPSIAMDYVLHKMVCKIVCFKCKKIFRGHSLVLHQKQSYVCKTDGYYVLRCYKTFCGRLLHLKQPNSEPFLFLNRSGKIKSEDKFILDEFPNEIHHLKSVEKTANKNFHQVSDAFWRIQKF